MNPETFTKPHSFQRDANGRSQWEELMPTLLQWVVQPEASQAGCVFCL